MVTTGGGYLQGFIAGNRVKFITGGSNYFNTLIQLIHTARHTVQLQTYIFSDDETGTAVAAALQQAAARGVQVYVMADGYASQPVSNRFIQQLRAAGVYFRFFEPLFKNRYFYFGRRLHHKIVVADGTTVLVGGRNIANRYNDLPGRPAWLDFALLAEGPAALPFCEICNKMWVGQSQKRTAAACIQAAAINTTVYGNSAVRARRNDWVRRQNEISGTYIEMLRKAKKEITVFCSYFLPGRFMRRLLANASKRGVTIKVVTAGPSDVPMAKYAERWLYDWLLRNNIRLYEYQPAVLHAKIAVCDSEWLTVGSYNINNISAYASIELNADVYDAVVATAVHTQLDTIIQQQCVAVTKAFHRKQKNIFRQFIRWISYETVTLLFFVCTFYYKARKE